MVRYSISLICPPPLLLSSTRQCPADPFWMQTRANKEYDHWDATKIIQMRQDIEHNPHKYLSNTPSGMQASASQPPDPHWITFLIFILKVGCCVSLHPLGGAEHKTTFFPNNNIGSSERLAMQKFQIPRLVALFTPLPNNNRLPPAVRMLYWLLPPPWKQKSNRLARIKGVRFLGVAGGNSWRPGALHQHRHPSPADPPSPDRTDSKAPPSVTSRSNFSRQNRLKSTAIRHQQIHLHPPSPDRTTQKKGKIKIRLRKGS